MLDEKLNKPQKIQKRARRGTRHRGYHNGNSVGHRADGVGVFFDRSANRGQRFAQYADVLRDQRGNRKDDERLQ